MVTVACRGHICRLHVSLVIPMVSRINYTFIFIIFWKNYKVDKWPIFRKLHNGSNEISANYDFTRYRTSLPLKSSSDETEQGKISFLKCVDKALIHGPLWFDMDHWVSLVHGSTDESNQVVHVKSKWSVDRVDQCFVAFQKTDFSMVRSHLSAT